MHGILLEGASEAAFMIGWRKFGKGNEEGKLKDIWNLLWGKKWSGFGVASLKAGTNHGSQYHTNASKQKFSG
jgi:hypothetical protein